MASADFVGTWTVRGLLQIRDDIYLIPGNILVVEANTTGGYDISIKGTTDPRWNNCRNLTYMEDVPASIPNLPVLTSMSFPDYEAALTVFLYNIPPCEKMDGIVQLDTNVNTRVTLYMIPPVAPRTKRVILIKAATSHQNGTAHGDD